MYTEVCSFKWHEIQSPVTYLRHDANVHLGLGGEAWQGKSSEAASKLVVCGFYLFLGLALLTMCMNLMKEEVRANFAWIGKKVGLMTTPKKDK